MEKLKQVISFLLGNSPKGRNRVECSKLVYYSDAVYFQHHGKTITGERYIHLEDCPQPFSFSEALVSLGNEKKLEIKISIELEKLGGFKMYGMDSEPSKLDKEELRICRKVLQAFPSSVVEESRQYPNLYENYVITPIFSEIVLSKKTINTKIHVLRKKSLLSLSGKLFRVLYEE